MPQPHSPAAPLFRTPGRTAALFRARRFALLLMLLAALPAPPAAAEIVLPRSDALGDGGSAAVSAVVDGDTVLLADGREVRFVGIQAPKLPLGRPGFRKWPFADEAKTAVADIAAGKRVSLFYGGRETDRYGRALAHLVTEDGVWLQGALLRRGLARVYSFADNRALTAEMLALEAAARADRRGIWRLDWYAVTPQEDAARRIGEFALIEGRVADVATVRGRAYINFGSDYRTDFTLAIAPGALRAFAEQGIDIARYKGHRVRARGWVKSYNGPMIDITHPEQIEELSDETG